MSLPNEVAPLIFGAKKYEISRSLRFNRADTAYLSRTPSSSGNRKTWTWSGWVKSTSLSYGDILGCYSASNDTGNLEFRFTVDGALQVGLWNYLTTTTAVYRDPSAWYHIVLVIDTTQAGASSGSKVKIYVNGVSQSFSSDGISANISQNTDLIWNTASVVHYIGRWYISDGGGNYLTNMYLTEVNFVDGQALTPSSFGETDPVTGVWIPKRYTGTYGTNGFYLSFSNNASTTTLGYDDGTGAVGAGAGSNDWTLNNFSVTAGVGNDSLTDTPTNNYPNLNPLDQGNTTATTTNGNLTASGGTGNAQLIYGNFGILTGKWYWESTITAVGGESSLGISLISEVSNSSTNYFVGNLSTGYGYYMSGVKLNNGSGTAYGASYTTGDVIGIAFDADAGSITFYKNGVSQGVAFSSIPLNIYKPAFECRVAGGTSIQNINFGQRPFEYTPPTGYKALNTQNLPTPTILKGSQYMNIVTWTGTGATRSITGVGFQPDLVWSKSRSNAETHKLVDSTRGATKALSSETTGDEVTESGITSFNSDGFTIDGATDTGYNTNTYTYVGWNWKKGVTPGFDIVTYTGNGVARTISHSLGAVPHFMIVKARTTAGTDQGWAVYHRNLTSAVYYLVLNTNAAEASGSTVWNSTAPTSSVFSVGTSALTNTNNDTYLAYLWSEITGFSRFGTYTGNGSTDGPFVWCGFRPKFVLIKYSGSTGDWWTYDTIRDPSNPSIDKLLSNSNALEDTSGEDLDILSNGFKLRNTAAGLNTSTGVYVFAAFAENPFKYSLAR